MNYLPGDFNEKIAVAEGAVCGIVERFQCPIPVRGRDFVAPSHYVLKDAGTRGMGTRIRGGNRYE